MLNGSELYSPQANKNYLKCEDTDMDRWIKLISRAAEVYARNPDGSKFLQYVGDDLKGIMEQIEHDTAEGKIAVLTTPEPGYII